MSLPIAEHGLIGDLRSAAPVSTDGTALTRAGRLPEARIAGRWADQPDRRAR